MTEPRRVALIKRAGRGTRGPSGQVSITEAGLACVEESARDGLAFGPIARRLGIDHNTLLRLCDRDPRVAEAYERGRAGLEEWITSALVEKAKSGETVALIFLAKARLGWRDRGEDTTTVVTNVQTNAVVAMPLPEIRQRIELLEREKKLLSEGDHEKP